jgi:uncharacterized surface protein with fasciclin (FAS1) repeats
MSNIAEVVVAGKNPATMLRSVKATEMATELSKIGPFTVFVQPDLAFGKLASGETTELLKPENKINLTDILNYHVVKGKTNFRDLKAYTIL